LIVRFAGSRRLRSFAVIHHRGRRSGRAYATPVSARPTADGFVIPLTFGEASDWFQNVRAAGGCVIRWNGADYAVVDPIVVDLATAQPAFGRVERAMLPLMGIRWFALVRRADAAGHDSASDSTPDRHAAPRALGA
jgi:deazaflavin-dependent oxidoreductase (nitroreductase family)